MAQYTAFISYSHRDRAFADWLHRRLEAYRVPAKLVGSPGRDGPVPARLYPVFRDREELPTSDDLGTQILGALERSATLIVICSPDARESRWVNEEISSYRRLGRGGRILAIVARGEPNAATRPGADPAAECFPPALVHIPATADAPAQQVEPIAADARPEGDGREHALLKIIAGILGIGFEALRQRELEASRRRTRIAQGIAAAMVVLAVAATGAGWLAWQARGVAEARRVEAEQATKEEQRAREAAQRSLGAARGVLLDMTSTLGNARHFGNLGNTALQEDLAGVLAPRFNEVLDLAPDPLVAGSELDARWLLGRLLLRFGDMERAKPILEQGFNDALARVVGGTPTAQDELRLGRAGALFAEVLRRTGDWNQSAEVLARTTAVLPLPPFQTDLSAMSVERLDALSWLAGEASWHEPWNATTRFRRDSRARHAWLAEALLQRQPDDLEALMQVAFAEQQLAWSFRATAELEDAISAAGRATALARTAFQRAPINITAIRILVDARYVLAVARHEAQRAAWQEGFIRVFDADDPMSLTDANIALLARILLTEPRLGDLARQAVDIAGYAVMLRTERGEHTAALSNALGGGYSLLRFAASREAAVLLNDQMQYLAERLAYTLNRMRAEPFSDNFSKSPDALSLGNTCANLAASLAGGSTGIESAAGGRLLLLTFVGCQLRVLERPAPETQILGMLRVAPRPTWRDQVGQIPALLQRHAALIERIPSIVSALPAGHVALPELLIDLYAAYRIQIADSGDMARAIGLLTAEVEMLVAASDARPENVYVGDRHAAALRARASLHRSAGALREAEADLTTCSSASTIRFPSLACAEDLIAMLRAGDADAVRIAALQRRLAHLRRASLEVRVARGVNDGLSEGATISVPLTEPPPGFQGIDHLALWNQRSRGIILDRETVARLRDVHRDAASRGVVFSALATATDSTRLVFFDFGRATLTDRARQILAEVAQRADLLRPARILVVSHVDSYEADPRNRREVGATDSQISIMRAAAVASELERLGIPRSSIEVVTRGAEAPLVPTPPNTREPQNRRVEISFQ